MPKLSPESNAKRIASKKEAEPKHMFDLCGWEVWIDPLNYQIRKNGKKLYWTTFIGMLNGLNNELEKEGIRKTSDIISALSICENRHNKLVRELKEIIADPLSLGQLEWH